LQSLGRPPFEVNWFSDGGLTSNLPVHFFDSPLSIRPTFAIDLVPFNEDFVRNADEKENSFLRTIPRDSVGPYVVPERRTVRWEGRGLPLLASFGGSLLNTARNWVDESTLAMVGYRERVVTIGQEEREGGINLSMSPEVMARISLRGRYAARKLVDTFGPDSDGWPRLRWIQFRTATAALSDWLERYSRAYDADHSFYDNLLSFRELQPSYGIPDSRLREFNNQITELRSLSASMTQKPTLTINRPQIPPVLRLMPPVDTGS
jgi:hypothetical protein